MLVTFAHDGWMLERDYAEQANSGHGARRSHRWYRRRPAGDGWEAMRAHDVPSGVRKVLLSRARAREGRRAGR